MKNFSEWLKNRDKLFFEAIHRDRFRPELSGQSVNRFAVNVGDIIEMGPETKHKGQKANRLAKVLSVTGSTVSALDLSRPNDNLRILIPVEELYNKEDLLGRTLYPADERFLSALGGKTLWVRLTPRQYKKFKAQYRAKKMPEIIPSQSDDDSIPDVLKRMFDADKEIKEPEPRLSLFEPPKDTKKPKIRPGSSLSSYINRKKTELGD